eukprot:2334831-Amphidinium_carterae.1
MYCTIPRLPTLTNLPLAKVQTQVYHWQRGKGGLAFHAEAATHDPGRWPTLCQSIRCGGRLCLLFAKWTRSATSLLPQRRPSMMLAHAQCMLKPLLKNARLLISISHQDTVSLGKANALNVCIGTARDTTTNIDSLAKC